MLLSNQALFSAFLLQHFFVDTNSQQCFKNIHTKKKKKTHDCFPTLHRFAQNTQERPWLVCWFDCSHSRVSHEACISKPFYLLHYLCTKPREVQSHFSSSCKRARKDKIICFLVGNITFPGRVEGSSFLNTYLFSLVEYQLLSFLRHRIPKAITFPSQPLQD